MVLTIENSNPTLVKIREASSSEIDLLHDFLTFRNKQVEYQLKLHKKNIWFKRNNEVEWTAKLEELKDKLVRCVLFENDGEYSTYRGLIDDILLIVPKAIVENKVVYPQQVGVAWDHLPKFQPRFYQEEAKAALLSAKHGAIQLPTGAGKSSIIVNLCHDFGLQSLIVAPTTSIAKQLYSDFTYYFGKKYVGLFGSGKKEVGKKFTIAIDDSLVRVKPDSEAWNYFSKSQVVLFDESHLVAAATLEKLCMRLVCSAPYRFFVSATQLRGDGSELVLKGIIGPIVYEKRFDELVDAGFLAKPQFRIIVCRSNDYYSGDNALKMTQRHLLYNTEVIKKAAEIANGVAKKGHRVLILIEEKEQFSRLYPLLTVESRFAYSGEAKNLAPGPRKQDNSDLVEAFDNGEFPVLVGTSCIALGTDLKSPETVIYLQGGVSKVQILQALGRGTRKFVFPDGREKKSFNFVDFLPVVVNRQIDDTNDSSVSLPHRHALTRIELYEAQYPNSLKMIY